jgi:anti-sigma regulatory factor (Ser/Thr protein kinase)
MQFTFQFPPTDDAPAQARASVDVLEHILAPALLQDLQLIVSELVTNSVKFGPRRAITLSLRVEDGGRVRGEVIDRGDGERARPEMSPEPSVDGGWGLYLVDRLARRWGVTAGSTHVWFELLPARGAEEP